MRHRGGDSSRKGLHERKAGGDSIALAGFEWLTHRVSPSVSAALCSGGPVQTAPAAGPPKRNRDTSPKAAKKRNRENR
jgi:hypothetical protein